MIRVVKIASVVSIFAFVCWPTGADAQEIMTETACIQAVADARAARDENPALGDKSAKIFTQLVELASQRCEEKQFKNASQLLQIARGMVSSE